MQILVVDDDPFIRKLTCFVLTEAGYDACQASDRASTMQILQDRNPELVLLDVSMPQHSGFEICREIRSRSEVPIIFVSARSQVEDRVTGLQLGGDDYIVKPFEPLELLARIEAVLRRRNTDIGQAHARLNYGGLSLDPVTQEVTLSDNRTSELTPVEFRLLHYLMQNAGRTLTTDQILHKVWGYSEISGRNLVAVYIRRLRSKIEPSISQPRHITTVTNIGYRFETS
jgi:DNA-binding response OmpR family regulator